MSDAEPATSDGGPVPGIDWEDYGYVLASHYRVDVLEALDTPKIPSAIASEKLRISHVSRALQKLRERGYVDLLVEEDRKKGRVYGRTALGDKMAAAIEEADT